MFGRDPYQLPMWLGLREWLIIGRPSCIGRAAADEAAHNITPPLRRFIGSLYACAVRHCHWPTKRSLDLFWTADPLSRRRTASLPSVLLLRLLSAFSLPSPCLPLRCYRIVSYKVFATGTWEVIHSIYCIVLRFFLFSSLPPCLILPIPSSLFPTPCSFTNPSTTSMPPEEASFWLGSLVGMQDYALHRNRENRSSFQRLLRLSGEIIFRDR